MSASNNKKGKEKNSLKINGLKIKKQWQTEALFHTLQRGSFTVEASLVLPLFLFTMVTILFLFRAIQLQYLVGNALDKAVAETALLREKSSQEVDARTRILFYKGLVELDAPVSMVRFGAAGFSWKKSKVDDSYVDIKISYQIKFPGWILGKATLRTEESSRCRRWVGDKGEGGKGEEESWVYVTPNGRVYHKSRTCTHLKLSIESVSSQRLRKDLKKYRKCEHCVKKEKLPANVYVANEGECYHIRLDCSGLKRTLSMVKITEVGNKSPCTRCKGE